MRPEVAGEHQLLPVRPELDDAGAEDVPGIAKGDLDAVEDAVAGVVRQRAHLAPSHRSRRPSCTAAIVPLRPCARRRLKRSASLSASDAESSSMIAIRSAVACCAQIGPRKPRFTSNGTRPMWSICAWLITSASIDAASNGNASALLRLHFRAALAHAAIQQDALAGRFDQVHGTGDLAGRAVEMHSHVELPDDLRERTAAATTAACRPIRRVPRRHGHDFRQVPTWGVSCMVRDSPCAHPRGPHAPVVTGLRDRALP